MTGDGTVVVWADELLSYDLGDHPLDPVRVELTIALARSLGVLDRPGVSVVTPEPATTPNSPGSTRPLTWTPSGPRRTTRSSTVGAWAPRTTRSFEHMHEAAALVAGASLRAAQAVWTGEARRAVNVAGGLHHAMPARASGFCVYNDPAVAIQALLDQGAERVAYVDVDVHHGDGVQAVFWEDPRVLTVSLHETPLALFPGTGFPHETGGEGAEGSAVNVALPPGTDDSGWLRAFHAVVPSVAACLPPADPVHPVRGRHVPDRPAGRPAVDRGRATGLLSGPAGAGRRAAATAAGSRPGAAGTR